MSDFNASKWVRRLEFVSLMIDVFGIPFLFLFLGLIGFLIIPRISNQILGYSLMLLFIFIGIIWDTKYSVGGYAFVEPFRNYLNSYETNDDRNKARLSFLSSIGVIIFILMIIIISYRILFLK